jgi:hypothetical protein
MQTTYYCLGIEIRVVTMSWMCSTVWRDKKYNHMLGNAHLWNREGRRSR